jgi:O-antigen/teichoic acid export membrane protein
VALAAIIAGGVGPLLSAVHGNSIVGWILSAYGLKLMWQNVYAVPQSLMKKELRFKELSVVRVLSNVAEFGTKVGSAALGFGVWCFVVGPLARNVVVGIGIQVCRPWRPRLLFRWRDSIEWIRFGLKQSASQIIYHVYSSADYQIVGAYFGPLANGLYGVAYELVLKPCYLVGQTIQSVAFPAFVYDPKWAPAAGAAQLLCAVGLLRAMSLAIPPLLDGVGRPGLNLRFSCIAGVIMPSLFAASAALFGDRAGYMAVAWAWVVGYPFAFGLLLSMALRELELPLWSYVRNATSILTVAGCAVGASVAVRWLSLDLSASLRLAISLATMLAVFLLLLWRWVGISPSAIRGALER